MNAIDRVDRELSNIGTLEMDNKRGHQQSSEGRVFDGAGGSETFLFVHFRDSKQAAMETGAHRYGRLLQEKIDKGHSVQSIGVPADRVDQIGPVVEESNFARPSRLVIQLSPHFWFTECVQWSIALAKHVGGDGHIAVLHDARNMPIPLSRFLNFRLYKHPRTLWKAMQGDARLTALGQLCRHGFRIKVFDSAQKKCLPLWLSGQVDCVPHFIESPVYSFENHNAKKELGLQGRRLLTVLGWVNPRKGNELALEALLSLPEEYVLAFAGGAIPGQDYLERFKKLISEKNLDSRVKITGYLSEVDQAKWIAATDLGIGLFRKVSASGSLSTWMSHERPVLVSALPELEAYNAISPGSLLVEASTDPKVIAARIRSACEGGGGEGTRAAISALKSTLSVDQVWSRMVSVKA